MGQPGAVLRVLRENVLGPRGPLPGIDHARQHEPKMPPWNLVYQILPDRFANGTVGFLRTSPEDPREFCLVFLNPTIQRKRFTAHVPASRMFADLPMRDLLTGNTVRSRSGALEIRLPPLSAPVYVPEYQWDAHYDFAKRLGEGYRRTMANTCRDIVAKGIHCPRKLLRVLVRLTRGQ